MINLNNFKLRKLIDEDLEIVFLWRNSKRVRKAMFTDHVISIDEHRKWFKNILIDKSCSYHIFLLNDKPIGLIGFTKIVSEHNRCYWGFYLGEEGLPRKTGTVMGYFALNQAFESLKVRKICAEVLGSNEISINFHQRLLFQREGSLRKHILRNGIYEDVLLFAQFKDNWKKHKKEIENLLLE